jgi:L-arabinokinase
MNSSLQTRALKPVACDAPGRLDFLGGVADYSGSLVLEMPTQVRTSATLAPIEAAEARFESEAFGVASLPLAPLRDLILRVAKPSEFRAHLESISFPRWARYPLGCFIVLALQSRWFPESGFNLNIRSTVPDGQGVSSSAALEIATLRAFNEAAGLGQSAIELARLGQRAENLIVGASCGLMDQLASACGQPGALLPILCRPDSLYDPLPLPTGLTIVGWPSGVKHHVGASPYSTARAAAFMGKRMLEKIAGQSWKFTSEIPPKLFHRFESALPESMTGEDFLSKYQSTDDPLTTIDPAHVYPARAATRFPIEENGRAHRARELLTHYSSSPKTSARELREILSASHHGYSAMGLGSPETDEMVRQLLAEPLESGIIGGRISGGGSGGTVVVLLDQGGAETFQQLAMKDRSHPPIY